MNQPVPQVRETGCLDLQALAGTRLHRDPFDFIVVPDFLKADWIGAIVRDYPRLEGPANHALDSIEYGAAFERLVEELNGAELNRALSRKFGLDLARCPTTITVRGHCERSDGDIHTDHWSKVLTAIVYFNPTWEHEGGALRFLRSKTDIEDFAAEVPPLAGTLAAFRRSDRSFHGHKRLEGQRRMLQMSWLKANPVARCAQKLDRFGTHLLKRLGLHRD